MCFKIDFLLFITMHFAASQPQLRTLKAQTGDDVTFAIPSKYYDDLFNVSWYFLKDNNDSSHCAIISHQVDKNTMLLDEGYRDRVHLKDNVSLILNNVVLNDEGFYYSAVIWKIELNRSDSQINYRLKIGFGDCMSSKFRCRGLAICVVTKNGLVCKRSVVLKLFILLLFSCALIFPVAYATIYFLKKKRNLHDEIRRFSEFVHDDVDNFAQKKQIFYHRKDPTYLAFHSLQPLDPFPSYDQTVNPANEHSIQEYEQEQLVNNVVSVDSTPL